MRLRGRSELCQELEHADWLRRAAGKHPHVEAPLLDAAVLSQQPGSRARARAAHWALRPAPLALRAGRPPAVQLTALALARVNACARASRVPLGEPRSTFPKYPSASVGCISPQRSAEPGPHLVQVPGVPADVPSASPAEARARTNPASTSVPNRSSSSAETGSRNSRRSRTAASQPEPSGLHPDHRPIG